MEKMEFIMIAVAILGFGLVSRRLERTVITPPMVFTVMGLLAGTAVTGLMDLNIETPVIHGIAQFTLIMILFTDAARIDVLLLIRERQLPLRLLGISLPLVILLGTGVATVLFPEMGIWQAALLAALLAPTDAALGQAVVTSEKVPVIVRTTINVESGLNDGICLPVILMLVSATGATHEAKDAAHWIEFISRQLIFGPLVGMAVGYCGVRLVERSTKAGWMNKTFQRLAAVGLALLAFALAEVVEGNGFIAAFCAGLGVSCGCTISSVRERMLAFGDAEGEQLVLITFLIFGGVMVAPAMAILDGRVLLFAVLALTAIRMAPVSLSLIGLHLPWATHLFIGWFGPRGIASILFGLIILKEADLPGHDQILSIVVITVLVSIFAHGLTAYPGSQWYARQVRE